MAYFPKFGPFYDPKNEQEFYGERDGRLRLRHAGDWSERYTENGINHSSSARPTWTENKPTSDRADSDWTGFLQDHGNLFYIESTRQAEKRQDARNAIPSRKTELNNNHSRQNSHSSDTNESPRTINAAKRYIKGGVVDRQSSADNESLGSSGSSFLNERHLFDRNVSRFNREDRQRCSDGSSQSDQSYTTFSEYLDANSGPPKTSQKRPNQDGSNAKSGHASVNQTNKRKSIVMVPNLKHVTDVYNCSGVLLCEKLFGIKLCNYKDKPPRPNGSSVEPVIRDRKVIVQGVIQDSQADICNQIHRGDMLVGLNDVNVTWVNIDELIRTMAHQSKVKLTFQVPVVIGPKQSTPPVTPARNTPPLPQFTEQNRTIPPPLPPHIPLQPPAVPPRQHRQRPRQHLQDLVHLTTGETVMSLDTLLKKHLFCVLYLTFGNQSDGSKDDVIYQYPVEDNKLIEIRGLYVTLVAMMKDVTNNNPKLTCVKYREQNILTVYWRNNKDVLVFCLPESRVPANLLYRIFSDFINILKWQHFSVSRVFEDKELHGQLDQLISLILYRELITGVATQSIPHCSPLEPQLLDILSGIRWLRLNHDDKILCDEILSEFEAQDFMELDVDPDVRRKFGILGSCLFYKDYLLCSHLFEEDLQDIHLFLKYHAILYLVNKQPVEDLVLWREIYPSRIHCQNHQNTPAYTEPNGRWFLMVVGMKHFLHCTILESGGYSSQQQGKIEVDPFFLEQSRTTLAQLQSEDTDIEQQCIERLFSELHGPRLKFINDVQSHNETPPIKSPYSKSDNSPRFGNDESDRLSIHSPEGAAMRRQGSRISRSSNDSNGSSGSAGISKNLILNKKGSIHDISVVNRSFTDSHHGCNMKVTRSSENLLLHYVSYNQFDGVYVSPTPCDLSTVSGPTHEHVLYNFYGCCKKIHKHFQCIRSKQRHQEENKSHLSIEEAVMFTCQLGSHDPKRPPKVFMYWVVGRLFGNGRQLFVCLEDGAPQTLLELAFNSQFGLS